MIANSLHKTPQITNSILHLLRHGSCSAAALVAPVFVWPGSLLVRSRRYDGLWQESFTVFVALLPIVFVRNIVPASQIAFPISLELQPQRRSAEPILTSFRPSNCNDSPSKVRILSIVTSSRPLSACACDQRPHIETYSILCDRGSPRRISLVPGLHTKPAISWVGSLIEVTPGSSAHTSARHSAKH